MLKLWESGRKSNKKPDGLILDFDTSIQESRKKKEQEKKKAIEELEYKLYKIEDGLKKKEKETNNNIDALSSKASILVKKILEFSNEFGFEQTKSLLASNLQQLYEDKYKEEKREFSTLSEESELKGWFYRYLYNDFYIYPEVEGVHLKDKKKVVIDYLLFPKPHLIEHGFVEEYFGIEVKCFDIEEGFVRKTSRGLWQAISYNDCVFRLDNSEIKVKFNLLFSNLSFPKENELLRLYGCSNDSSRHEKWSGMLHLANHAQVGQLLVDADKYSFYGWHVNFGLGGIYFVASQDRKGKTHYKLRDGNLIDKIRVGNF